MSACVESRCQSESAIRRERVRKFGEPKPHGYKLGTRCGNPRCISPFHAEWQLWSSWREDSTLRQIAYSVNELPLDGKLDLPEFPNGIDDLRRLRSYLAQMTIRHVIVRALYPSGVRVFASGNYLARKEDGGLILPQRSEKNYPAGCTIAASRKHPDGMAVGCFFLGLCWKSEREELEMLPTCSIKGCVYPAFNQTVCRYHSLEELDVQFSRSLDKKDMIAPREYPWLPLTLFNAPIQYDQKGFLYTITDSQGPAAKDRYTFRSRAERMNDEWWQENVINKGLLKDSDGVICRTFKTEEEMAQEIGTKESRDNIRAFFASGIKHNMGHGGRGKIRKKQRNRPAGWHGSRDSSKKKRWDRETIEAEGDWDYTEYDGEEEDDYGEESVA